ncbi:MAG TPA: PilZ domain-containing protein, partial [Bryobacteraceae bacterium]|nr:PilZ domain-containing protein [Bryobacteraceae bacterium]
MERRAGPRYEAGQSAQARLLDGGSDVFPVRIENVSGAGMRLLLDRPLALGALIKVEWDDVLLLGEVRYC